MDKNIEERTKMHVKRIMDKYIKKRDMLPKHLLNYNTDANDPQSRLCVCVCVCRCIVFIFSWR